MAVFFLPIMLQRRASALDNSFPHSPVHIHVDSRATQAGVEGFASNGRVWIASGAFRPDTMAGLHLIGHELAHLAQQKRAGTSGLGALEVVDDPALEAAADCFGAAFADPSLFSAPWLQASDVAAPCGPVQCNFRHSAINSGSSTSRIIEQALTDGDDEDDGDEPPFGGGSAFDHGKGARFVENAATLGSMGVQKINTGVSVASAFSGVAATALTPVALVLGPAALALAIADSIASGVSAAKTYCHIERLNEIYVRYRGVGDRMFASEDVLNALLFTLAKKNSKLKKKLIGVVPIAGGTVSSSWVIVRSLKKRWDGTIHVHRTRYAGILWAAMKAGDPCATEVCVELIGVKVLGTSKQYTDGWKVLYARMNSH